MKNKDLVVHLKNRRAETLSSLVAEELERMIIRGELQAEIALTRAHSRRFSALAAVRSAKRAGVWKKATWSKW